MAQILEITDLHKSFGSLEVLKGVSLDARAGDVVSLIGSSGSGKSTLLRCINMLALLEKVGISAKVDAFPAQLSGGQQQRAAIARALCINPRIMLFDEPTSALDPELEVEVLGVIKMLADEGRTMILVTHDMKFAREVSDRVVFLHLGKIEEQGTVDEVFGATKSDRLRQFLGAAGHA